MGGVHACALRLSHEVFHYSCMLLGTISVLVAVVLTFLQTVTQGVDVQQSPRDQHHLDCLSDPKKKTLDEKTYTQYVQLGVHRDRPDLHLSVRSFRQLTVG